MGSRMGVRDNGGRKLRIAIIGAGPGGLCMGKRLLDEGFDDFVLLEKSDGVGGTWNLNRYPGCECDIQSALYSFSFEFKSDWSKPYGTQPEILEYMRGVAEKYGLLAHTPSRRRCHAGRVGRADRDLDADARVGRHRRRRRGGQRHRDVQRPGLARHRGARLLPRHDVPLGALGLGPRPRRRAHRRHRERGQRRAVRSRDRRDRRPGPPVPAHGQLGAAEARRALRPRPDRGVPGRPDADARVPGGGGGERQQGHDVRRPGRQCRARGHRPGGDRRRRGSRGPAQAPADAPVRLQAPADVERLLPGVQRAEPRARHRPHRARHGERGRHRRRGDARGRHDHPRHRLRGDEVPLGDRRRSGAAAATSTTRGTTGRRPISASRRRGSRTCSCSTARTRTTARS